MPRWKEWGGQEGRRADDGVSWLVELGRQRQGRVEIERQKTVFYGGLLVGADELASDTG